MRRHIALVHFTAQRDLGGVERLLHEQAEQLLARGHAVTVVAGDACGPPGSRTLRIPRLHPAHPDVAAACAGCRGSMPAPDHPLALRLKGDLEGALAGVTDCWVHNALTVWLNPFLTQALRSLILEGPDCRWVAWCEDLSAVSRHISPSLPDSTSQVAEVRHLVRWVAISEVRRHELASVFGLSRSGVEVIRPPLDTFAWLSVGEEAGRVWRELELHTADLMVLVPAKALPHKRLDRALEIGVALRRVCRRPKVLITAGPSPHEPDGSARLLAGLRSAIARLDLESTVHVLADLIRSGPGHGTIRDLMLLCDVVLLPSDEEGFGLPLWEAAALRVPIVCSNIAVFHEIAGDAAVFVGHETEDVAVARAIAALAHSPRNRLRREALASRASFAEALDRLLPAGAQPNV